MRRRESSRRSKAWPLRLVAVTTVLVTSVSLGGTALAADTTTTTAPPGGWPPVNQPGVNDTTIRVGGVTSTTNPLQGKYDGAYDGVKAYFDMVNSQGGIYGRKLDLVAERDDQISKNKSEVQALLDQDNVFAVLPVATIFQFSGADTLQQQGVPTFGWNINEEYKGRNALFGDKGALCFGCVGVELPWLAKKLGKKHVAVLAYNTTANSKACADGVVKSFAKYNTAADVAFVDSALSFGATDFSVDVSKMKDAKVDFVTTCMDTNAVFNLAKEMRKQGVKANQYLPNGYDAAFMKKNGKLFEKSIVLTSFAPFESTPKPAGLAAYLKWMKKKGYETTENSVAGWINADQFVNGLTAAGPDFTRAKVIAAINQEKAYNAQGMIPPIDWTTQHDETQPPVGCSALSQVVKGGKFKPVYTKGGKPFVCFNRDLPKIPKNPSSYA